MTPSAKELKRRSRAILTGRYVLPMSAFALSQALNACVRLPFELSFQSNPTVFQGILSTLAGVIISLLSTILSAGQIYIHLNMARGTQASVSDVFRYFNRRPDRFILSGFILLGISIPVLLPASAATLLAFRADTVPAYLAAALAWAVTAFPLVLISLTYALTNYLLVEQPDSGLRDIFRESRRLMKGKKGKLFYLEISFLGMILLSILSLGIGFLWVIPYRNQAYAEFYLHSKESGSVRSEEAD